MSTSRRYAPRSPGSSVAACWRPSGRRRRRLRAVRAGPRGPARGRRAHLPTARRGPPPTAGCSPCSRVPESERHEAARAALPVVRGWDSVPPPPGVWIAPAHRYEPPSRTLRPASAGSATWTCSGPSTSPSAELPDRVGTLVGPGWPARGMYDDFLAGYRPVLDRWKRQTARGREAAAFRRLRARPHRLAPAALPRPRPAARAATRALARRPGRTASSARCPIGSPSPPTGTSVPSPHSQPDLSGAEPFQGPFRGRAVPGRAIFRGAVPGRAGQGRTAMPSSSTSAVLSHKLVTSIAAMAG